MGAGPTGGMDGACEVERLLALAATSALGEVSLSVPVRAFGGLWVARRWRVGVDGVVRDESPRCERWTQAPASDGDEDFPVRLDGRWVAEPGGAGGLRAALCDRGRVVGVLEASGSDRVRPLERTANTSLRAVRERLGRALALVAADALLPARTASPGALRAVLSAGQLVARSPALDRWSGHDAGGGLGAACRALATLPGVSTPSTPSTHVEWGARTGVAVLGFWGFAWEPLLALGGVTQLLVTASPATLPERSGASGLSPRQREVASFAAAGATIAEIARATRCAPETVKTHLKAVYHVLGVGCRVELAAALERPGNVVERAGWDSGTDVGVA